MAKNEYVGRLVPDKSLLSVTSPQERMVRYREAKRAPLLACEQITAMMPFGPPNGIAGCHALLEAMQKIARDAIVQCESEGIVE